MRPALIWGSVGVDPALSEQQDDALGVMARLSRQQGEIWRDPHVTLAQFGGSRGSGSSADRHFDPLTSRYRVVAACRFDNRIELCHDLGLPESVAETFLIAAAYRRWGEACPEHFLGDFAFALWDTEARQLFCARDPLGILPFYYWQGGSVMCFASDLEGLLAHPQVAPRLDLSYVKAFLLYDNDFVHPHYSFFDSVFKLPPGHSLKLQEETLNVSRYWDPATVFAAVPSREEECVEQLRSLLSEAVRCRLAADSPTGAHLSSGLDSSTVAALAARLGSVPLQTFSWSWPGDLRELSLSHDERNEIEVLKAAEGLEVHYTDFGENDLLHSFSDLTRTPQVHQARENMVLAKAQDLGIHTLLSGWGGDESISYYGRAYLSELVARGRLGELACVLREWSKVGGRSVWYGGLKRAVGLNLPEGLRRSYNRFWEAPRGLPTCLSAAFREALERVDAYPWDNFLLKHTVRADQVALLTRGPISYRTEAWHASATRYGLSYLYPLLDQRVVEFALNLPSRTFFRNGQPRHIFRQATQGILPETIRLKTLKRDPAVEEPQYVLFDTLMREGKLRNYVASRLHGENRYLNASTTLASLEAAPTFRAYVEHPSGVNRALWLAFLHLETYW